MCDKPVEFSTTSNKLNVETGILDELHSQSLNGLSLKLLVLLLWSLKTLETVGHFRKTVKGCGQDGRESSSASNRSNRSRRREHTTRRRQHRPSTRPHSSNFSRNAARNQRQPTTTTLRVWESDCHERNLRLPDPWINHPSHYYECSTQRWDNREQRVPVWQQQW